MHDLIIIGAGPAGLTSALYAGRSRLKTLVLEKMSVGGRIMTSETIENYPGFIGEQSTHELIRIMEGQVKALDINVVNEEAASVDCKTKTVKSSEKEYSAKAGHRRSRSKKLLFRSIFLLRERQVSSDGFRWR